MSITDELREELAICVKNNWMTTATRKELLAIADRIDAEHERALGERNDAIRHEHEVAYSTGYEAGFDEGLASTDCWSADDWTGQHEDAMAERGWVKLPVDADGVTIHVGERVQLIGNDPSTVSHMSLADDGWRVYVKYDGGIGTGSGEPKLIHHHKPTVEGVLDEIVDKANSIGCAYAKNDISGEEMMGALQEIVAEYAAKLRLAGDAK